MAEIALAALVGFLLGLPIGAFVLVSWVNRYTSRQVSNAHAALDKLKDIAETVKSKNDSPTVM